MRTALALIAVALALSTALACSSPQPGCAAGCTGIKGPDADDGGGAD